MLEIALQYIMHALAVMRHTLLVEILSSHVWIEIISPVLPQSSSRPPASHLLAVNMPLFYTICILSLFISLLFPTTSTTASCFSFDRCVVSTFFSLSLSMHMSMWLIKLMVQNPTSSHQSTPVTIRHLPIQSKASVCSVKEVALSFPRAFLYTIYAISHEGLLCDL